MITVSTFVFAFILGVASTLPLGPSGMSIVSAFALLGSKKGMTSLLGLLGAEVLYMGAAFFLRAMGVLVLSHFIEVILTLVFSAFLIAFGFSTYKNRKNDEVPTSTKPLNIFLISVMNPTILIFYLGLMIMAEKRYGDDLSTMLLLVLGIFFLLGVVSTLMALGELARQKGNFIRHNMSAIKFVLGPLFIILGIGSAIHSF